MGVNKITGAITILAAYGLLLGISALPVSAEDTLRDAARQEATYKAAQAAAPQNAPAPGSEGDTLTREDARMALLVYKLLGPDGKIKGANIERGKKLFYQNCRACHGTDGHRLNFAHDYRKDPIYIGDRARNDMPTFWYQVNFGDEDRNMEAYIDEFSLEELIDIAGFAQTLP